MSVFVELVWGDELEGDVVASRCAGLVDDLRRADEGVPDVAHGVGEDNGFAKLVGDVLRR